MPKIYSDSQRKKIQQKLFECSMKLFKQKGFLKSSVADIANCANIATGTFYNFFSSKEMLFFELMGEAEQTKFQFIKEVFTKAGDPKEELRLFLQKMFSSFINDPVYLLLYEENLFERIVAKISPEELAAHMKHDIQAAKEILNSVQSRGYAKGISPAEFVSHLRSLFMTTLHHEEIGVDAIEIFMFKEIDIFVEGISVVYGEHND